MYAKVKSYSVNVGSIFVFLSCLVDVDATLKTTFVEDLCRFQNSPVIDFRYQTTGILMAAPSNTPVDCLISLMPNFGYSLVLSINRYDLDSEDKLTIEDSDRYKFALIGSQDFPNEKKAIISEGKINVYYFRNSTNSWKQGFQFTFTHVKNAPCSAKEFRCKNDKCIPKELACDGHNHCGDNSNQKQCYPKEDQNYEISPTNHYNSQPSPVSIMTAVGFGIGGIVLLSMLIMCIVSLVKKRKSKKQQKANQPNASG